MNKIYIYVYTHNGHTHTHTHIYIYIFKYTWNTYTYTQELYDISGVEKVNKNGMGGSFQKAMVAHPAPISKLLYVLV